MASRFPDCFEQSIAVNKGFYSSYFWKNFKMLHRCIAVECFNARKDGVSYHWPDDLRYAKLWTNAVKNLTHTESTNSTRPSALILLKIQR